MPTGFPPPALFDRALIARRRAGVGSAADFLTELVLAELAERLAAVNRRFGRALLIGPTLAGKAPRFGTVETLLTVPTLVAGADTDLPDIAENRLDLVVSLLDLQVVNDVPGYLVRLKRLLGPDGLFIAALVGGRSLAELRAAWIAADSHRTGGAYARVAPFMDVRDAGALLQRAGFALPVSDADPRRVRYPDALALMRELKALGAANPMAEKPRRPVTEAHLAEALAAYPVDADGRIGATLELIWMSGWAPDDRQPRPLRPGSAEARCADVLKKPDGQQD